MISKQPVFSMPDVQSCIDTRQIPIQRVGIKALRYPLAVCSADGSLYPTVGDFNLDVALRADQKGTHMSRFVELLEEYSTHSVPLDFARIGILLNQMLQRLNASAGRIEVNFPYFIRKAAPVSGVRSLLDYQAGWMIEARDSATRSSLKVAVPVTSLCPCSKEISQYGAHNQRSQITICAELNADVPIEALIQIAEEEASCELWGLLKRPDEKFVTERAYDNPKFVEDLVRDIAVRLNREERICAYIIEAENFESIHNHNAYARVEHRK